MSKLDQMQETIKMINQNSVTPEEFIEAFEKVIDVVKTTRDLTEKEVESIRQSYLTALADIRNDNKQDFSKIKEFVSSTVSKELKKLSDVTESKWGEIQARVDAIKDGQDADEERVVAEVLAKIPPQEKIDLTPLEKKIKEVEDKIIPFDSQRLDDIERIAKSSQMPITTSFINGKRAKNIQFNNAVVAGDLANISIPIQTTAPENPTVGMLWIDSN